MRKNLPIGREDFKTIIEENFYYVDKTKVIEEMLRNQNYISLFPRPRRFGKSLFLSMLDNFFNLEYKETNKNLFKGLAIEKSEYYDRLSSNPVIKVNFKRISGRNYKEMYLSYISMIRDLFIKKEYLKEKLSEAEKEVFENFEYKRTDLSDYQNALYILSS